MSLTGQALILSLFGLALMSLVAASSAAQLADIPPLDVAAAATVN